MSGEPFPDGLPHHGFNGVIDLRDGIMPARILEADIQGCAEAREQHVPRGGREFGGQRLHGGKGEIRWQRRHAPMVAAEEHDSPRRGGGALHSRRWGCTGR